MKGIYPMFFLYHRNGMGILIGAFISSLIYNRQKNYKETERILQKIQEYEQKHIQYLKNILSLRIRESTHY